MIINQTYSGGGIELSLVISVTSGSVVTATKGGKSVTGMAVDGVCVLVVPEAGTWIVSATLGGKTTPAQAIQVVDQYPAALEYPLYVEELSVGDSVWMDPANASASKIEFLVVHQGKPSSDYDDSCNGTWLMAKTWKQYSLFGSYAYSYSTLRENLAKILSALSPAAQEIIRSVTIPSKSGGVGPDKLFVPSATEVGLTASSYPVEGAKLDYFDEVLGESAKRAFEYAWWTRSVTTNSKPMGLNEAGEPILLSANSSEYARSFCVIPSKTIMDADHNLVSVGE